MLIDGPTKAPALFTEPEIKTSPEVEPEIKRAPRKRRFWHRKPSDAEVLRGAIDVINERGWKTGEWIGSDGRVCILGAIGISALRVGRGGAIASLDQEFQYRVMSAADNIVGTGTGLWPWNDGVARSAEDVKHKLFSMSAKAVANGGKYPR